MSTSSISTSTVNGTTRITGLSSGIDVDGIVEQLVTAEKAKKLNKLQQEVQTAEWKQDAYQTIIADIQDFSSTYFDITSSSSIMKTSNFLQYDASSSDDSVVTATCSASATAKNHTIEVSQLATAATLTSGDDVQGSATADYSDLSNQSFVMTLDGTDYTVDLDAVTSLTTLQTAIDTAVGSGKVTVSTDATTGYLVITAADDSIDAISISDPTTGTSGLTDLGFGTDAILTNQPTSISKNVQGSAAADCSDLSDKSFVITLDGTDYTVELDDVTSADTITTLQAAIDDAVGSGKVTVSTNTDGYLEITAADDGVQAITLSATSTSDDGLTDLGFGTDAILSNRLDTSDTLATIAEQLNSTLTYNSAGKIELTINGTTKTFATTVTLASMMSEINKADLGVTMSYNEITGALEMTADDTGAGNTLVVADGGTSNFVSLLLGKSTEGKDAKVTIDGQALTRSSNTMTIDGVTYTVNQETTEEATVSVTQDTDGVYDLISKFVEDYNTLIDTISTAIDENADSDYPPLTDDQKADMTDEEIEAWEIKAKVGLLESDSTLETLLSDLRTSLIDSVSGQTISLASIGITSSDDYGEDGKLYIDEDTLTEAIASDPEAIMELFTQQATSTTSSGASIGTTAILRSLSSSQLSTRYKEEGIAYRFYDTLQKNISTIRDNAGNKGTLLEKAGAENEASEDDNTLTTLIDKYTEAMDEEEDRLDEFEENLYDKYTTLETYISTMNSQLSSITSLTSS